MILSEKSITLQSVTDINEICQPLFNNTDITFFTFMRVFDNGMRACLTSHAKRTKYLFEHDYKESMNYKNNSKDGKPGFVLWNSLGFLLVPSHRFLIEKKMADGRNLFNIDHGITLFENGNDYQDYYNFGTKAENIHITDFYLSNMDILNAFVFYFKDKAKILIHESIKQKIILPNYDGEFKTKHSSIVNKLNFNRANFFKEINHQHYFLGGQYGDISITKREAECWIAIIKGNSIKEAGRILNISSRTIETHLKHLKQKLNISSMQQLTQIFWGTSLSTLINLF